MCIAFTFISHNIWKKFYRKEYKIFSEDRHRKENVTFFATDNNNRISHYKYER